MSSGADEYVGSMEDLIRRYTLIITEASDSVILSAPFVNDRSVNKAETVGEQTAYVMSIADINAEEGIEVLVANLSLYYNEYSNKLIQPRGSAIVL
jgi:hypothetical protein